MECVRLSIARGSDEWWGNAGRRRENEGDDSDETRDDSDETRDDSSDEGQ